MKKTLLALFLALSAFGQTLPNAVPPPAAEVQFLDANGQPLSGGKLYTYAAGTTTPQATYTDSSAGTPNTNPIILDSAGRAQIWIGALSYKFVLQDANSVVQWTEDNIQDTTLYFVNYVKTAGTATLISYTPPTPPGGAATTVAHALDRLLAVNISVTWYGAVCDGSTDDAQAIQNAFNAAHTNGGGTVLFPVGLCAVGSSATGKDMGVTALLQKYQNVNIRGAVAGGNLKAGGNSCYSGMKLTAMGSVVMMLDGDANDDFTSHIENFCFVGSGAGTGVWLGGDPSGTIAPNMFFAYGNVFTNVRFTNFSKALVYGNFAGINDYVADSWENNGTAIYAVPLTVGSGSELKFFGGILAGNTTAAISTAGILSLHVYGTQFENNGTAVDLSGQVYAKLDAHGVHWESNGAIALTGAGGTATISITGGDAWSQSCAHAGQIEVSGADVINIDIRDMVFSLNNTSTCPLIDAQSIGSLFESQVNLSGINNYSPTQAIITSASNIAPIVVMQVSGGICVHCDTTQGYGAITHGLQFPGLQVNSDPANGKGVCFGPMALLYAACDWTLIRANLGMTPVAQESGLLHNFANPVSFPGGILNSVLLSGAPGSEFDYYITHTGAASPTNLLFAHAAMSNNVDYAIWGEDGTTQWFPLYFAYATKDVTLGGQFTVNSVTGALNTHGNAGHTGSTCSAWVNGLCTAP